MYKNTKVDLLLYSAWVGGNLGRCWQTDPLAPRPGCISMGVSHKIFGRTGDAH